MRAEYTEIMNALEMPQPAIATLWKEIQNNCTTPDNASEYLKTLESLAKNVEYNREGQRPFFTIFKTYTCLDLENERGNIVDHAQRAVEEFGVCGSDLNAAVARWFLGQVYSDQGDAQHSQYEFQKAIGDLGYRIELCPPGQYEKVKKYQNLIDKIRKAPGLKAEEYQQQEKGTNQDYQGEKVHIDGYLRLPWIPIYSALVRATPDGAPAWKEPGKNQRMEADTVILDGHKFAIQPINKQSQSDRQVTLTDTKEDAWGWAPVAGKSMNAANPPIEESDYVLFKKSSSCEHTNIVIASLPNSSQSDELYRYVVKRFIKIENEACFLCSETKETSGEFEDIPLDNNIHILGIVVAVAKRQDQ